MATSSPFQRLVDLWRFDSAIRDLATTASRLSQTPINAGRRAVVNGVVSTQVASSYLECVLGALLTRSGVETHVLFDDGILFFDELKHRSRLGISQRFSPYEWVSRRRLSRFDLTRWYSEFLPMKARDEALRVARQLRQACSWQYDGLDLEPFVEASVVKYTRAARGLTDGVSEEVWTTYLANAVLSTEMAKAVEQRHRPDIVVSSHAIYSTFGPFCAFFRERERRVICYGLGAFKPNGVVFSAQGLAANRCDDGYYVRRGDSIDQEVAQAHVASVMNARSNGAAPDLGFVFAGKSRDEHLLHRVEALAGERRCYGVFPNVMWDASIVGSDVSFPSITDWLTRTVRFLLDRGHAVVVRVHPAEDAGGVSTDVSAAEIVRNVAHEVPGGSERLLVIPAESGLRSYQLFPSLDAVALYGGTVGLEAMWHELPVFVGGLAPYSNVGITLEFENTEQYFHALDQLSPARDFQRLHRDDLIRYLYMFFFLNEVPLSFFDPTRRLEPVRNAASAILGDKALDYVVKTIAGDREFFQDWHQAMSGTMPVPNSQPI